VEGLPSASESLRLLITVSRASLQCTSDDLTDDWSLASTHFVDSQYEIRCAFGCVLLSNPIYLTTITTPIHLINLPWKLWLGLELDFKLHYFSIFSRIIKKTSTFSSTNFTEGNIVKKNVTTFDQQQNDLYIL